MGGFDVMSPAPRHRWGTLLGEDPDALPTQGPEAIDAMCTRSLWHDASRLYTTDEGRSFVLPMVRLGPVGPTAIEASPRHGWGYGGVVAPGGVTRADLEIVARDLAAHRVLRRTIRPNPTQAEVWRSFTGMQRVASDAHVIDLSPGIDVVYKGFNRNARRNIKIAERAGVAVEIDRTGRLLDEFFDLYHLSRARWAHQQHEPQWLARIRYGRQDPTKKWRQICSHLGPQCAVMIARVGTRPAAGGIILFGQNAHFTRAAMDLEIAGPTRATDALEWESIKESCASGARWYQMGHSSSPGVAAFKERFGAVRVDYDEFVSERLPVTRANQTARSVVKQIVRFDEDATGPPS